MAIIETILFGFFFGVGVILSWIIFQLIALSIRDIYVTCLMKKLKKSFKKPKGMEFGKFND